jgi:2,3-bisphosphoglycerate-independent phosphoglycerate mutase
MPLRLLVIFFDGLGDRPVPELGGLTPLEAARTPNIDRLASEGITGLLHAKSPGYALGSPLALHLLFGYEEQQFPDRGPLLATARGVEQAPGQAVLAARFACAVPEGRGLRLVQRFVTGREEACEALAAEIASHEVDGFLFRYVYSDRGDGLLLIDPPAAFEVTDTDPLGLDLPMLRAQARAGAADPEAAARTAAALNAYLGWAHHRLSAHPASAAAGDLPAINCLLTKWAGPKPDYEPFQARWGLRPASLPDEEVVTGLMLELGFEVRQIAEDEPEAGLRARLDAARELLDGGAELVHLHTKYPDPISHQQDPEGARDAIEALDRAMASYWDGLAGDEGLITVLTGDHTTPSVWADHPRGRFNDLHSGEPCPIVVRGGNVRVDDIASLGERAVVRGGLGLLRGEDFMPVLLDAAQRMNMYEMRPLPERRLYRPDAADLVPFELDGSE